MQSLILASASPQRKDILRGLGLEFEVIPSSVEEGSHPEWSPRKRATELARLKAEDVAKKKPGSIVIGCDTLVVSAHGTLLEKPLDRVEAEGMIRAHSGRTSIVHSALCVIDSKAQVHEGISSSSVTFKELSTDEIEWWLSTELWKDRSGGFQIDGLGQLLISRIEGDWTSIVGLPVFLLGDLMRKAGFPCVKFL